MSYSEWEQQRQVCAKCRHRLVKDDAMQDKPGTIWRCMAIPVRGRGKFAYCIDARDGKCGKEATLFEAA